MQRRKRGFTLIELIVVVAIIALLAAILLPAITSIIDDARLARCATELRGIKSGSQRYLAQIGAFPPTISDWGRAWGDDPGLVAKNYAWSPHWPSWKGPYMEAWTNKTPWGGLVGCGAVGAYYFHSPIGWFDNDGAGANDHYIHMNPYCASYPPQNGIKIDRTIDDGNPNPNGKGVCVVTGGWPEYVYYLVGEGPRYFQ